MFVPIVEVSIVSCFIQILQKMWSFSELHEDYKKLGWKMNDFQTKPAGYVVAATVLARVYFFTLSLDLVFWFWWDIKAQWEDFLFTKLMFALFGA